MFCVFSALLNTFTLANDLLLACQVKLSELDQDWETQTCTANLRKCISIAFTNQKQPWLIHWWIMNQCSLVNLMKVSTMLIGCRHKYCNKCVAWLTRNRQYVKMTSWPDLCFPALYPRRKWEQEVYLSQREKESKRVPFYRPPPFFKRKMTRSFP